MTAYNIACLGMGITFIGDLLLSRVPTNSELVFYKLPGQSSKRTCVFLLEERPLYQQSHGRIPEAALFLICHNQIGYGDWSSSDVRQNGVVVLNKHNNPSMSGRYSIRTMASSPDTEF